MTKKKSTLTHIDAGGDARMVDVGDKDSTKRAAMAEGRIRMEPATLAAIRDADVEKGDVLAVAKIAGIMAGKRAADWVPLCHPLQIDVIDVSLDLEPDLPGVRVRSYVGLHGRTGAEMEALVAASAALLTVYDMCKALDRSMEIEAVRLVEKSGGQSGTWRRDDR